MLTGKGRRAISFGDDVSFSYNFGNNPQVDQVRMLIADTDSNHPIFQDEEIINIAYAVDQVVFFPAVQSGVAGPTTGTPSARRAAAVCLDALAANKARLSAALEVLDIKLDASKAADQLRKQAADLRQTEMDSGAFGIAEMYLDQFTGRQRIWKQLLRIDAA